MFEKKKMKKHRKNQRRKSMLDSHFRKEEFKKIIDEFLLKE